MIHSCRAGVDLCSRKVGKVGKKWQKTQACSGSRSAGRRDSQRVTMVQSRKHTVDGEEHEIVWELRLKRFKPRGREHRITS